MSNWMENKQWSDKFLPSIKAILGVCLIVEPPIDEDMSHNTDLIVLKFDSVRIACRVRNNKYLKKYPNEFTIRMAVYSGNETELSKIIAGWGDYLFYGFCNEEENDIESWKLISLKDFRLWFGRELLKKNKGEMPGMIKYNHDGSSSFLAFDVSTMPESIIYKQSLA